MTKFTTIARPALRKTVLAVAAAATMIGASAAATTTAQAGGYGYGVKVGYGHGYKVRRYKVRHYGYRKHCFFKKRRIVVGYNYYGHPVFKWKVRKICR